MDKKYLLINMAVAGIFGVVTGKLVGYYNGLYEGALETIDEKAKEWAEIDVKNKLMEKAIKTQNDLIEKQKKDLESEDFKEWKDLKYTFHLEKGAFSKWLQEQRKEEERQKEIAKAKKAIEEKDWDMVYRVTEHWYNHYPVDMSRAEVFGHLQTDGYITKEQTMEAHDYFGNLWFYVGD